MVTKHIQIDERVSLLSNIAVFFTVLWFFHLNWEGGSVLLLEYLCADRLSYKSWFIARFILSLSESSSDKEDRLLLKSSYVYVGWGTSFALWSTRPASRLPWVSFLTVLTLSVFTSCVGFSCLRVITFNWYSTLACSAFCFHTLTLIIREVAPYLF